MTHYPIQPLTALDVRAALEGDSIVLRVRRTQKLRAKAVRLAIKPNTPPLVRHLADVVRGNLTPDEAKALIAADPTLVEQSLALARLQAGVEAQHSSSGVAMNGATVSDVVIGQAAGRDINHITINIVVDD
jgi:hypothetical protein